MRSLLKYKCSKYCIQESVVHIILIHNVGLVTFGQMFAVISSDDVRTTLNPFLLLTAYLIKYTFNTESDLI